MNTIDTRHFLKVRGALLLAALGLALGCSPAATNPVGAPHESPDAGTVLGTDGGVVVPVPQTCSCESNAICVISDNAEPECVQEATLRVEMRDNVGLNTHVFLPKGDGPFPTIMLRTPYLSPAFVDDIIGVFRPFVRDGYAYVVQSCRGTGASEGNLDPLVQEFADGQDAVRWITEQAWSDGKIGTIGGSYEGFTAIAAAIDNDAVRVVVADGAIGDAFTGWPMQRGMNRQYGLLWWLSVVRLDPDPTLDSLYTDKVTNARPLNVLDQSYFGEADALWRMFSSEMEADSPFWRARSLLGRLGKLCAPVLHIQANLEWDDDPSQIFLDAKRNACSEAAKSQQHFIKSSMGHAATLYSIFLDRDLITSKRIFDTLARHLKGVEPLAEPSPVLAFVEGQNEWVNAEQWPLNTQAISLHLSGADETGTGTLSADSPAAGLGALQFNPDTDDPCSDTVPVLYYQSEALIQDLDVVGNIQVDLEVETTVPDADLFVYVGTIDEQSRYNMFAGTSQRLRFRNSYSSPEPMVLGQRQSVHVSMPSVTRRAHQGERLWLYIAPGECGMSENPQTGGPVMSEQQSQGGTTTIHAGGAGGSVLRLPVLQ